MKFVDQFKKLLNEMFDIAGFDKKTQDNMIEKVIKIWLVKIFIKMYELMDGEEVSRFSKLSKKFDKNISSEILEKEILMFMSNLTKAKREKVIDIIFYQAGDIVERMINKFNLKATPEQKKDYFQRIIPLLNDLGK